MPPSPSLALIRVAALALLVTATWPLPALAAEVSEQDYYRDLPVVLSVSRLAQPLNDTPGAVTVIDKDFIRRSGARELADLLRLVPGFVASANNGAAPLANYHGDFDSLNRRLQVLIDGRSVYSTMMVGNVSHPMMGVVLDDIERIEVLRGSNSATYGANAFSGVVNIITRNAADVPRASVITALGEQGILDRTVRLRLGEEGQAIRLTASRRGDHGMERSHDDKRVDQLHIRGDLQTFARDDLLLAAGYTRHEWGAAASNGSFPRNEQWRNAYAHLHWQRHWDSESELSIAASMDEEDYINVFPRSPLLSADGRGRRLRLEATHKFVPAQDWRVVWGAEWRREEVRSPALMHRTDTQATQMWRLFGNAEWHLGERWLINGGALLETHPMVGPRTAPRLMANYHLTPGHTLRIGSTTAYRLPTLFELTGDWRAGGVSFVKATGGVRPERLVTREIGYLGEIRALDLALDLRGFEEAGSSVARFYGGGSNGAANDVVNKDPYRKRGWESQWRWRPRAGTQVLITHTALRIASEVTSDRHSAPRHITNLAWFQDFPGGVDIGLMYTEKGPMTWVGMADMLPRSRQLDLRLARKFQLGSSRAEAALTIQNANGSREEFVPEQIFSRRAFLTLRLDY